MRLAPVSLAMVLVLSSCGGDGGPAGASDGSAGQPPQVAGQYQVAVRLTENSCGQDVVVAAQPTSVTHTPGAAPFTLTHGGLQVTGTVARDGAFSTQPLAVQDPLGPATIAIAGRFGTQGFDAVATVTVQRTASSCSYRVAWTGTKQGAPNVLAAS